MCFFHKKYPFPMPIIQKKDSESQRLRDICVKIFSTSGSFSKQKLHLGVKSGGKDEIGVFGVFSNVADPFFQIFIAF